MKVGIIAVFVDYHRNGAHHRGVLQPQIGPLIAALLPPETDIHLVNDAWEDPDWRQDYDLLFISCLHADFDRARQISHYWRRRGARTVLGGTLASTYPDLCQPYFDAVVVGDCEGSVPQLVEDFRSGALRPRYVSPRYDPARVPTPRLDLAAGTQLMPLGLEAFRGCPFGCEFCALTALGTRFHSREPESVVRDVMAGRRMLEGIVPWYRRRVLGFYDNNIGGSVPRLRRLCKALEPLGLVWASSCTFNVLTDPDNVRALSRSGCRFLFVGLESFNPAALEDMRKRQNRVDQIRSVIDFCRNHGILVVAGLMLSPTIDDLDYVAAITDWLERCGLGVPSFISFETPLPGTPYFRRLAAQERPALLPNALLRDFTGYTLVVRPARASTEEFVGAYRSLLARTFAPGRRVAKVLHDLAHFLPRGWLFPAWVDVLDQFTTTRNHNPRRTLIAGTDTPPPESVPLVEADFDSEDQRAAILEPMRVTDDAGWVLPPWLGGQTVYRPKGRVAVTMPQVVADIPQGGDGFGLAAGRAGGAPAADGLAA